MRIAIVGLVGLVGPLAGCGGSSGPSNASIDVVVQFSIVCHQGSGDLETPSVVSPAVVPAYLSDDSRAGYRVVTGTSAADHSLVFHDIPAGATFMVQGSRFPGSPHYYVTDQPALKLRTELQARCQPAPAPASAPIDVAIDLTNASGISSPNNDRLDLHSFKLGIGTSIADDFRGTELQATIPWRQGFPLVDAAAGDDLYVVHSRTEQGSEHIVEWFDATGATLQNGQAASITGAFQSATSVPASLRTIAVSADLTRFEAPYTATTRPDNFELRVTAQPGGGGGSGVVGAGSFGAAAMLLGVALSPQSDAPFQGTFSPSFQYADPFPASWKRTITVRFARSHLVRMSANPNGPLGVVVGYQQQFEYAGALQVAPALAPPTGITVGGVDFTRGGKLAFDGQSPVAISWNPVPGAQLYEFAAERFVQDSNSFAELKVTTAGTSLKLPAAMFEAGPRYQLVLTAIQTPTEYSAGELIPASLPQVSAAVPSGRFRFLPSCGDGIVQAEEDCDTGGESATCNVDCTTAMCGDGVINAAAGEQCDAVSDSLTCSPDCKLH